MIHKEKKCIALTKSGRRCRRYRKRGEQFCSSHSTHFTNSFLLLDLKYVASLGCVFLAVVILWSLNGLYFWLSTKYLKEPLSSWSTYGLAVVTYGFIWSKLTRKTILGALLEQISIIGNLVSNFFSFQGNMRFLRFVALPAIAPVLPIYAAI